MLKLKIEFFKKEKIQFFLQHNSFSILSLKAPVQVYGTLDLPAGLFKSFWYYISVFYL